LDSAKKFCCINTTKWQICDSRCNWRASDSGMFYDILSVWR